MARPKKEGMDYFPHDTDALSDEKIELLTGLYGNDGYAFYFIMLERIYRNKDFCIDVSDAETKEEMFQILSKKTRLTIEEFKKILKTSFKYGLFDKELYEEKGIITSNGIKKRTEPVISKRISMRKRYITNISDAETKEEMPQSKEKKSKEKKSKEKKSKEKLSADNFNTECIQDVHKEDTQVRIELGKDRIDKTTINNKYTECIQDKSSSDSSKFNIFTYMQQRGFISISSIMAQQIQSDIEMYSLEEVKQAIDIADNNGKHSYSYVKGILEKRRSGIGKEKSKEEIEWGKIQEQIRNGEDPF